MRNHSNVIARSQRVRPSAGPMINSATKQSIRSLRGEMDCFAEPRRAAPPDDRLQRTIQYSETSMMKSKSHGVLDTVALRAKVVKDAGITAD
jgi:hypothetical protein